MMKRILLSITMFSAAAFAAENVQPAAAQENVGVFEQIKQALNMKSAEPQAVRPVVDPTAQAQEDASQQGDLQGAEDFDFNEQDLTADAAEGGAVIEGEELSGDFVEPFNDLRQESSGA